MMTWLMIDPEVTNCLFLCWDLAENGAPWCQTASTLLCFTYTVSMMYWCNLEKFRIRETVNLLGHTHRSNFIHIYGRNQSGRERAKKKSDILNIFDNFNPLDIWDIWDILFSIFDHYLFLKTFDSFFCCCNFRFFLTLFPNFCNLICWVG